MDEILASIKRIIAEDGPTARPGLSVVRPAPRDPTPAEAVLELTEAVAPPAGKPAEASAGAGTPTPPPAEAPAPPRAPSPAPSPAACVEADMTPPSAPAATLVSPDAACASRQSLSALSSLVVRPAAGEVTLDGMVRDMLRPMLKEWLDAQLPAIVEKLVAREIARITAETD